MQTMTRSEAMALGLKNYFTGKPCKHGHISERHISGTCLQCDRENKARAYQANPEKFRERVMDAYRQKNDGRLRHQRPKISEDERREKTRAAVRSHYARNTAYYTERSTKRRARKLHAVPPWFGEFDHLVMSEAAKLVQSRGRATGIEWHTDHIIPLAARKVSGLHVGDNIQVIPGRLNKHKGNKLILTRPGEWIRHV